MLLLQLRPVGNAAAAAAAGSCCWQCCCHCCWLFLYKYTAGCCVWQCFFFMGYGFVAVCFSYIHEKTGISFLFVLFRATRTYKKQVFIHSLLLHGMLCGFWPNMLRWALLSPMLERMIRVCYRVLLLHRQCFFMCISHVWLGPVKQQVLCLLPMLRYSGCCYLRLRLLHIKGRSISMYWLFCRELLLHTRSRCFSYVGNAAVAAATGSCWQCCCHCWC